MEPVRSEDCRLLLSLLKYAIVPPDQLERVEGWIRAKEAALSGMERMEKELREMHKPQCTNPAALDELFASGA